MRNHIGPKPDFVVFWSSSPCTSFVFLHHIILTDEGYLVSNWEVEHLLHHHNLVPVQLAVPVEVLDDGGDKRASGFELLHLKSRVLLRLNHHRADDLREAFFGINSRHVQAIIQFDSGGEEAAEGKVNALLLRGPSAAGRCRSNTACTFVGR